MPRNCTTANAAAGHTASGHNQLPKRDQATYKNMMRMYENKQYRKANKLSDAILKANPDHGETTSMKGLILYNLPGRREEALNCVKKGLRLDIKNHMCWHIMGILHRSERNYEEALKCLKHASRFDSENIALLKDVSLLQLHKGLHEGFLDTRRQILSLRPAVRGHWWPVALAYHLCREYDGACGVLESIEEHLLPPETEQQDADRNEASELYLYKGTILNEAGRYDAAYEYLNQRIHRTRDRVGSFQLQMKLLIYLRRFEEAHNTIRRLLDLMPENEDIAVLWLATSPHCRHLFSFPSPPPAAAGSHRPPHCSPAAAGLSIQAPVAGGSATGDVDKHATTAAFELNPRSVLPHGSRRIGWLMPPNCQWHDSPYNRAQQKYGQLLNTYQTKLREAKEQQTHDADVGGRRVPSPDACPPPCRSLTGWRRRSRPGTFAPFRPLRAMTAEEEVLLMDAWKSLSEELPTSRTVQRLPLYFLTKERLSRHLHLIIFPLLNKFVYATFELIKPLYASTDSAAVIQNLLEAYLSKFGDADNAVTGRQLGTAGCDDDFNKTKPSPMFRGAVLMLMAQHEAFLRRPESALKYVDAAIDHTPTVLELYVLKASILKQFGDEINASVVLEEAREADLADRYLNIRSVKGLLRIDQIEKAREVAHVFSHQSEGEGRDMQCMWYELAAGAAYSKRGEHGKAMHRFQKVMRYYSDFKVDRFEFHAYCLRRFTYVTYYDFIRMGDRMESHQNFRRAARGAIRQFLRRLAATRFCETEFPPTIDSAAETSSTTAAADVGARQNSKPTPTRGGDDGRQSTPAATPHDDSADWFARSENTSSDCLQEAVGIVEVLRATSDLDPKTHELAYDVYSRMAENASTGHEVALVMLQSLVALWMQGGGNIYYFRLVPRLVHFLQYLLYCPLPSTSLNDPSMSTPADSECFFWTHHQPPSVAAAGSDDRTTIQEGEPQKPEADVDFVVHIIRDNLSVMFGSSFTLTPSLNSKSNTEGPSRKLDNSLLLHVLQQYTSNAIQCLSASADADLMLAACKTARILLRDHNNEWETLSTQLQTGIIAVPNNSHNGLYDLYKLTAWLREFCGKATEDPTAPLQQQQGHSPDCRKYLLHCNEESVANFETACRARYPQAAFWQLH